jgi:hypothetical protein
MHEARHTALLQNIHLTSLEGAGGKRQQNPGSGQVILYRFPTEPTSSRARTDLEWTA